MENSPWCKGCTQSDVHRCLWCRACTTECESVRRGWSPRRHTGEEMKRCPKCGVEKDLSEYNWKNKAKGIRYSYCKACWSVLNKDRYQNNKQYYMDKADERTAKLRKMVQDYKSERGCERCGETHIACLDLHHIGNDDKLMDVAKMVTRGRSLASIMAEVEKCIVLCANCHRKEHWK